MTSDCALSGIVASGEDWLIRRILSYAKSRDYTKYTSTLEEAWRVSVSGLSRALIEACESSGEPPELGPDDDFQHDPIAGFGVIEAQRHRSRGITLSMFLGLMKYYRQGYLDLVEQADLDVATRQRYCLYLNRFFDRVELGFCTAWCESGSSADLDELQQTNRLLTNEKNKYLTIFESLTNPKLFVGPDEQVEDVNRAAAALLDLPSRPGASYYHGRGSRRMSLDEIPWLVGQMRRFVACGQQTASFEHSLEVAGQRQVYQVGLDRMLDVSEKFLGTIVTLHDITERRQASEQLRQANEELNAWVAQLERRNEQMALISDMGEMLQMCQDSEEAHRVVSQFLQRGLPGTRGVLCILSNSRNVLDAVAAWGEMPSTQQVFDPQACWALRRGRMHVVAGDGPKMFCRHVTEPQPEQAACVPLVAQGDTLGMLHVQSGQRELDLADGAVCTFVSMMAETIALALANLRLRETLRLQSVRDPLTRLFNRRYMEETLERELVRAGRHEAPLAVIMLDIDHFKRFNDSFGHEAGDAAIRKVGQLLAENVRADDVVCRYGGEEFLVILPQAGLEDAARRAEDLRARAQELSIPLSSAQAAGVTLSLGVAAFPQHGRTPQMLVAAADAALYAAKRAGRNRVVPAEEAVGADA